MPRPGRNRRARLHRKSNRPKTPNMICAAKDCGQEARWGCRICIPPLDADPGDKPLSAVLSTVVCAAHWPPIDVKASFAEGMEMRRVFGMIAQASDFDPDFDAAYAAKEPLDSQEMNLVRKNRN